MSVHTREFVIFPFFSPTLAGSSVTKRKTHGLAPLICDIMPCTVASPPPPFVIIIFCLFEASYRTYGSIGKKNISPHRQKHFKIETKKKMISSVIFDNDFPDTERCYYTFALCAIVFHSICVYEKYYSRYSHSLRRWRFRWRLALFPLYTTLRKSFLLHVSLMNWLHVLMQAKRFGDAAQTSTHFLRTMSD